MFTAMLGEAWHAMGANRLRTFLTMLGMVIGVGVVPIMLVLQLLAPNTICALPIVTGATPFTPSSSIIASASFTLSVAELPPPVLAPPAVCEPDSTINKLLPIALMVCETAYCAP